MNRIYTIRFFSFRVSMECLQMNVKPIHNFVTISFYNNIVVKGRPQLSFLPPILLNQNFKLTENVQRFYFGRFLVIFLYLHLEQLQL